MPPFPEEPARKESYNFLSAGSTATGLIVAEVVASVAGAESAAPDASSPLSMTEDVAPCMEDADDRESSCWLSCWKRATSSAVNVSSSDRSVVAELLEQPVTNRSPKQAMSRKATIGPAGVEDALRGE